MKLFVVIVSIPLYYSLYSAAPIENNINDIKIADRYIGDPRPPPPLQNLSAIDYANDRRFGGSNRYGPGNHQGDPAYDRTKSFNSWVAGIGLGVFPFGSGTGIGAHATHPIGFPKELEPPDYPIGPITWGDPYADYNANDTLDYTDMRDWEKDGWWPWGSSRLDREDPD